MLEVNVERLPSYLIGEERGFERGFESGFKLGFKYGFKLGVEQGIKQEIERIANRLFELNYSMAEIVEITGLTIEELQQLSEK